MAERDRRRGMVEMERDHLVRRVGKEGTHQGNSGKRIMWCEDRWRERAESGRFVAPPRKLNHPLSAQKKEGWPFFGRPSI